MRPCTSLHWGENNLDVATSLSSGVAYLRMGAEMPDQQAEVLIVEDDAAIARLIELHLRSIGLFSEICGNGNEAMQLLQDRTWRLVILDRMLPGRDGMQVLRWLKGRQKEEKTPVLMVTALGMTADKVQGLNEGADDYLTKPFEPEELVARVQALLRRSRTPAGVLKHADVEVDPEAPEVRISGKPLSLRPIEFRLLHMLMKKPGKVRSREYLLDHVWGRDVFVEERTVDVAVKRLRKALAEHGKGECIETVRGMGYRFQADSQSK
ncbi:MAG: winged helix-turn-helix domain-containing protein [Mariprofundaceae bacterium]